MPHILLLPGMTALAFDYEALGLKSYEAIVAHILASRPDDDFFLVGWSFSGAIARMVAANP